jgi:hypothetical protein
MKERMTYYRRKAGKFVAEGKSKGKTIFLFTMPDIEEGAKSSLFPQEKRDKIMAKIQSLDYRDKKKNKTNEKVRTTNDMRNIEKDEDDDESFDIEEELRWGKEMVEKMGEEKEFK